MFFLNIFVFLGSNQRHLLNLDTNYLVMLLLSIQKEGGAQKRREYNANRNKNVNNEECTKREEKKNNKMNLNKENEWEKKKSGEKR